MMAAAFPEQRPDDAKLLTADGNGHVAHRARSGFADLLRCADLVIANDAATLPASLSGKHLPSGEPVEVRLAGRDSLAADSIRCCTAVVFGAGDFRVRTEERRLPPPMNTGDRLTLGPLHATIAANLGHPRLVRIVFEGSIDEIWEGLARHGRPIQYSHITEPLALLDVWTSIAGSPAAFEAPSAGFSLDWSTIASFKKRGVQFATVTHAAGISSTGDAQLDARLPFDEPYFIPPATVRAATRARALGGRIVAIGTTVVRALEHSAQHDGTIRAGAGVATQRIGRGTRLRVVDAMLSGTHEPGTSHYELLRAFVSPENLRQMDRELATGGYRTHEFGDSVFVEAMERAAERLEREPSAA